MKAYNIKPVEIKLESNSNSFTVLGLSLGEQGRGRQRTIVPVERESQFYNLGRTKTGNPKLFAGSGDSDGWIARISCEGCYTRDTNGRASATEGVAVIARGHGAEGDAGRLGTWGTTCYYQCQMALLLESSRMAVQSDQHISCIFNQAL